MEPIDQLALDEGRRAIDEQVEALERLRTRATGFLATVLAVTGFMVGSQAPSLGESRWWSWPFLALALISLAGATSQCGRVLRPKTFTFTLDSTKLATEDDWLEERFPERTVARFLGGHASRNEEELERLHQAFAREISSGTFSVVFWLVYALIA